jgi:hypothetical protein
MALRIRHLLEGYSQQQQQYTYLTSSILSTDLTLSVADVSQISRGEIEINGQEIAYINTVNRTANTAQVLPGGRGWAGSTAAAAPQNAMIENNPIFPYVRVVEAINDTIDRVYPDLFVISTTKINKLSVVYNYALPADCDEVISVRYQIIGPSQVYPWMRRWRFDGQASTTTFPTGKSIELLEDVTPGREMVVTYMKRPSELVNPTDDFVTVTGLPASSAEAIIYGACELLAPAFEGPRLLLNAAEVSERAQAVPPGSAAKISQYFHELFEARLQEERRKLYDLYERPTHFSS